MASTSTATAASLCVLDQGPFILRIADCGLRIEQTRLEIVAAGVILHSRSADFQRSATKPQPKLPLHLSRDKSTSGNCPSENPKPQNPQSAIRNPQWNHSCRNASMGSTRAARWAGRKHASNATPQSRADTP